MFLKSQKRFIMKNISEPLILHKLHHYCAYKERCLQEVILKLKELGANQQTMAKIIDKLVKENFINEKRYAQSFVRGKFRINKWGKLKITAELRKRKIPEKFIIIGLAEIDHDDYLKTLKNLFQKKYESLGSENKAKVKHQLASYAISKGYEKELVWNVLKKMD